MTDLLKSLRRSARAYQRILGLQDWEITVELAPGEEMGATNYGQCAMQYGEQQAQIYICDPADWPSDKDATAYDLEATLLHEMLHIIINPQLAVLEHYATEKGLPDAVAADIIEGLVRRLCRRIEPLVGLKK